MVWARSIVDRAAWEQATQRLHAEEASLVGLWAEPGFAYMALMQSQACEVLTLACERKPFSLGRTPASAGDSARAGDSRPGGAGTRGTARHAALAASRLAPIRSFLRKARACTRYRSGRCTPASSSPATSDSPRTARPWCGWKQRLGYVHKGIDALMAGAPIERAAQLAGRVSGDSTVAFALAFA